MKTLTEEDKVLLHDYVDLKVEIKAKTKELEVLKQPVRDVLIRVEAQETPIATNDGVLSLRPRRKWKYSDATEDAMAKIKQTQKLEEATGQATFETNYDVYFK